MELSRVLLWLPTGYRSIARQLHYVLPLPVFVHIAGVLVNCLVHLEGEGKPV